MSLYFDRACYVHLGYSVCSLLQDLESLILHRYSLSLTEMSAQDHTLGVWIACQWVWCQYCYSCQHCASLVTFTVFNFFSLSHLFLKTLARRHLCSFHHTKALVCPCLCQLVSSSQNSQRVLGIFHRKVRNFGFRKINKLTKVNGLLLGEQER